MGWNAGLGHDDHLLPLWRRSTPVRTWATGSMVRRRWTDSPYYELLPSCQCRRARQATVRRARTPGSGKVRCGPSLPPDQAIRPLAGTCSSKVQKQRRNPAMVDAIIRGCPGVNDAQRGPLSHFASKSVSIRFKATWAPPLNDPGTIGDPGLAIDVHLTSLRTKRSLPQGANRTLAARRALSGP